MSDTYRYHAHYSPSGSASSTSASTAKYGLTERQYGNYKKYSTKPPVTVLPPAEAIKNSRNELETCLKTYREDVEGHWFWGLFFKTEQIFLVNDKTKTAKSESKRTVGLAAQCQDGTLRIYHGFETAGDRHVPIPHTRFTLYKAKPVVMDRLTQLYPERTTIPNTRTGVWLQVGDKYYCKGEAVTISPVSDPNEIKPGTVANLYNPGEPNRLDEDGMASLVGLDCSVPYWVDFSPEITKEDLQALFDSYDGIIGELSKMIQNFWDNAEPAEDSPDDKRPQKTIYGDYHNQIMQGIYPAMNLWENYCAFQSGIIQAVLDLWEGLKAIFLWITDPDSYKTVAKYLSNPQGMVEDLKKAENQMTRMLSVLKDEPLLFIVFQAVKSYCQLLTPHQVHKMFAEEFGRMLTQAVIMIIVPGAAPRMVQQVLGVASDIGSMKNTATTADSKES